MRVVAVAALLVACGPGLAKSSKPDAAPPASDLAGQTFGVPGEAMEYQVALRGVTIGRVQVAVGKAGWVDGRPAIIVRSRGTSAGVAALIGELTWELTTTIDLDSGLPLREIEESWEAIDGEPDHDRDETDYFYGHNPHTAVGAVRGWRSRVGQRAAFEVTINDTQFAIELWDTAREFLASAEKPAVRYDGVARDKYHFSAWVSDDEARVPLLLSTDTNWGTVTIELVRYDAPSDP